MFNPQAYAVRIEHCLRGHAYAMYGDANDIRRDPIGFMDVVLQRYEKISEINEEKAADFWDKYESFKGKRLDDFGEETAGHFAEDVAALFKYD